MVTGLETFFSRIPRVRDLSQDFWQIPGGEFQSPWQTGPELNHAVTGLQLPGHPHQSVSLRREFPRFPVVPRYLAVYRGRRRSIPWVIIREGDRLPGVGQKPMAALGHFPLAGITVGRVGQDLAGT